MNPQAFDPSQNPLADLMLVLTIFVVVGSFFLWLTNRFLK